MEPQPQLQPIQPRPEMPYADPATRPLDLKPAPRQPLDLKPAPRQPLDLRPRPTTRPGANATPQDLINHTRSNPFAVVEPVINNPLGYAPGKAVVGAVTTFAERATDPNTFNPATPFKTVDVPSLAMPAELVDDTPLSPTSRFSPDAIDQGAKLDEGSPAIPSEPGQVAGVPYKITWTVESYSGSSQYVGNWATVSSSVNAVGPISKTSSGTSVTYSWPGGSQTFTVSYYNPYYFMNTVRNGSGVIERLDGQTDPPAQEEILPTYAPNPARSASSLPDLDLFPDPFPDDAFMPGFQPDKGPLLEPPPTGEIVPYRPFVDDITDRLRPVPPHTGTPPEKNYTPPYMPDLDEPWQPDKPTSSWWQPRWPFGPVRRGSSTGTGMNPPTETKKPPVVVGPPAKECCGDNVARDEGKKMREALRDLAQVMAAMQECKVTANIPTWACENQNGQLTEVRSDQIATDLSQAFTFLAAEVAAIRQQLGVCEDADPEDENPNVLEQGEATEGETVWYVQLPAVTRQVELIITGQIPKSFRLYDTTLSGEQQGKFGGLTLSYPGSAGGQTADAFHQWCWTRRTSLYVGPPLRETRFIRVYVKPGLLWTLYDTGLRN